jgi:flagellar motor protein MotB
MRKLWTLAGIGMLSMTLGMPALTRAQEDEKPKQEEPKPEPKAAPKAEPKTEPKADSRQDEMKPPKQDEAKPSKHSDKQQSESAAQPQGHAGQNMAQPASQGGHIPDDKFRAHFGRQHTVVIRQPVIVEGQPRFQFGGYWFIISDPWPAGWLYTDDCYVDYVDGEYFLFDLLHPGVRVALVVTM